MSLSVDRDKIYVCSDLVYNGLYAQLPRGAGFGGPSEEFENESEFSGEMAYRLQEQGYDLDIISNAVYGKPLAEMVEEKFLREVKIWNITDPLIRDARKDHRTIDYRTALIVPLYPKRTTVQGEVVRVDWYADEAKTDLVLTTEIIYTRDQFGFATSRVTERKWVMNNGDYHPLTKVTKKNYTINIEDQIQEGKRRRENIVNTSTLPIFRAMQEILLPQGMPAQAVLLQGRAIMDHLEPFFNRFINNSSTITDLSDPNVGRKTIVIEFERMAANEYPWFNNPSTFLGGSSILQYLTSQFSI